ncbi:MAG: ABC transporter ATP-binding protein/permease [Butyrivibrio sp.]|nr:ABC transporter ATP-binding protein/permease [Butyrivibrio sp.]
MGVSVIVPLIQVLLTPQVVRENPYIISAMSLFHITDNTAMLFFIFILVIGVYIVKNAFLTLLSWVRARYASKIMKELSTTVMQSYMQRSYTFFVNTNTGDLLRGTFNDSEGVYYVIYNGLRIIAEGLTIVCICIFVINTDIYMAICMMALGIICIYIMLVGFRKRMRENGKQFREYNAALYQQANQAYQGIKEIMVMGRQKFFTDRYEKTYEKKQRCYVNSAIASEMPAYLIEAICVCGILLAIMIRVNNMSDAQAYVPKLAAFAMAAFRIMPSLGKISSAANIFIYNCPALEATYSVMKEVRANEATQKQDESASNVGISFNDKLEIRNAVWKYQDAEEPTINHLNLSIKKGSSIGIIGESGAGKSTLINVILGLFSVQDGTVEVDGLNINVIPKEWKRIIGYVPQEVYMTDDTIKNNVAFGIDENDISEDRVWKALAMASMDTYVHDLPEGLNTIVGERGIHFSGGQRQRLAIARALYYDPQILIFDEATSALDNNTERVVMEAIDALHEMKTLIIVAHRLSTIKNCDKVYKIVDGKAILCEES